MLVAASTECFWELPFKEVLRKLVDLEFSNVEVALHEGVNQLKPSEVVGDLEKAIAKCRNTNRLDVVAYSVQIEATGEE